LNFISSLAMVDAVDLLAAFLQFSHPAEDAPVFFQTEMSASRAPAACTYMASSSRIDPSTKRSASRLAG